MILSKEDIYKILIENRLMIDSVNQLTKEQVRYSHDVMVGIRNEEETEFDLRARNKSSQRRKQVDKILKELFASVENVRIEKPIGEFIAN